MDTGLLTNALTANAGVLPVASAQALGPGSQHPAARPATAVEPADESAAPAPDNKPTDPAIEPSSEPPVTFGQRLREQTEPHSPARPNTVARPDAKPSESADTPVTAKPGATPAQSAPELAPAAAALPTEKPAAARVDGSVQQQSEVKTVPKAIPALKNPKIPQLANLTADPVKHKTARSSPTLGQPPKSAGNSAPTPAGRGQTKVLPPPPDIPKQPGLANPKPAQTAQTAQNQQSGQTEQAVQTKALNNTTVLKGHPAPAPNPGESAPKPPSTGEPQAPAPEVPNQVLKQAVSGARSEPGSVPAPADRAHVIPSKESDKPDLNVSAPLPAKTSDQADTPQLGKTPDQLDTPQRTQTLSESPDGSGKDARPGDKALSGDSLLKNLHPTHIEASTARTETPGSTAPDAKSAPVFQSPVSSSDPGVPPAVQPCATAQTPRASANDTFANAAPTVGEQIRESITSSIGRTDQQITIRLNPPELGRVVVKFQEQDGLITGLLEAGKAQTRAEIQQALPQMLRNLQDSGVQIRRLEVVVTNDQPRHDDSAAPQQGGLLFQQNSPNPNDAPPGQVVNELLAEGNPYRGSTAQGEVFVTDESIDMLA